MLNVKQMVPDWITLSRNILCLKDSAKGNTAENYWSICCLPLIWKRVAEVIAESMKTFLDEDKIFPDGQKGCLREYGD